MKKTFKNPIDKDKITENPSILPYAHHVGSAIIKPIDQGKVKGVAMKAMFQQTESQLNQIKEQVETLIKQAQDIHDKIAISEKIYKADCGFKPVTGLLYHLYERDNRDWFLSMIGVDEWGKSKTFKYIASVELLADHTWKVICTNGGK